MYDKYQYIYTYIADYINMGREQNLVLLDNAVIQKGVLHICVFMIVSMK